MFKYAFVAGICTEWLLGAPIESLAGVVNAVIRALIAMLLVWMVLEAMRVPVRAVSTLDDKTKAERAALEAAAAAAAEAKREKRRQRAEAAAAAAAAAATADTDAA